MGLDQYLYRKSYLFTGDWMDESQREVVSVTKGGDPHPNIKSDKVRFVVEEVGYWRKANHIHKWFVDNVQKGVDDCEEYKVRKDQLRDLLKLCEKVIGDTDKAHELLPTTNGYFFGTTEYDQYYYGDTIETIDILKSILSQDNDAEFYYRASW